MIQRLHNKFRMFAKPILYLVLFFFISITLPIFLGKFILSLFPLEAFICYYDPIEATIAAYNAELTNLTDQVIEKQTRHAVVFLETELLSRQVNVLQACLSSEDTSNEVLQRQIESSNQQISQNVETLTRTTQEIKALDARIEAVEARLEEISKPGEQ